MEEDGNCLFRAVASQIYDNQDEYQKVRDETADHIIAHKSRFSIFETDLIEDYLSSS